MKNHTNWSVHWSVVSKIWPLNILVIIDMNHFLTNLSKVWREALLMNLCSGVIVISHLYQSQPLTQKGSVNLTMR